MPDSADVQAPDSADVQAPERPDVQESGLPPAVADALSDFRYQHLPPHLQEVSSPFADLAHRLAHTIASGTQLTVALQKLLESKDAAVRAALRG